MPSDRSRLHVDSPAELLACVPYLLGYHPTASLATVALHGRSVLNVARLDLPATEDQLPVTAAAARRMAAILHTHGTTGVILIGYGDPQRVGLAMRAARTALSAVSIPVADALRVEDGRYFGLACNRPGCCPPQGVPFDPTTTVAAATATAAGAVALPDRDALAARIAPATGPARQRMAEATAAAAQSVLDLIDRVAPGAATDPNTPLDADVDRALLAAARTHLAWAQHRYRNAIPVHDTLAAYVTVLVDMAPVRDHAARHTTGEQWEIDMWTDLAHRADPRFAAAPATLLALSALRAGNGTIAGIAVQRALDADPADRLANLLARAVAAGIHPIDVAALLAD
jgi:Domain of unknown function (DUF4192)